MKQKANAGLLCVLLGALLGGYTVHMLTLPSIDYWRGEAGEWEHISTRLNRHLVAARASVRDAARQVERAERACRTPVARGEVLPFVTTAYGIGCDAPGPLTSSGTTPREGVTVAADPRVLPPGSRVSIEGWGELHVHDTGGKVKGRQLDVFVADCRVAKGWGEQVKQVTVTHRGGER